MQGIETNGISGGIETNGISGGIETNGISGGIETNGISEGIETNGINRAMTTEPVCQSLQNSALLRNSDVVRVSHVQSSYYETCLSLEKNWVIYGFDEVPYVLQIPVKWVKYLIVFSGWGQLLFKAGREIWLDVLWKSLAFLRVSFGVWLQDDFDNYFDLEAKFVACNYQQEVSERINEFVI